MIDSSFTKFLLGLALAFTAMSCSKSNTQSVTIGFPDWNHLQAASYESQSLYSTPTASGSSRISLVSVNYSVNGNNVTQAFQWQRTDDNQTAPMQVTFSVPNGALIQALAVFDGSGANSFYYGDAMAPSHDGTLDLDLTNVAASQGAIEGHVIGRYLTGENSGPTGVFQYRFAPDASKPSMIVTQGEVFSGWMNTYGLSSVGSRLIQYTRPDGQPIFGALTSQDNSMLSPAALNPDRSARVLIPAGFVDKNGGGTPNIQATPLTLLTVGFFGPAADTQSNAASLKTCFLNVSTAVSGPTIDRVYSDVAGVTNMLWIGKAAIDANFGKEVRIVDPGLGANYVKGGSTDSLCASGGTSFANRLSFDQTQIRNNDGLLGFRGPFAADASGNLITATYNSGTSKLDVSFSMLPGAGPDLGGVSIFYRQVASTTALSSDDDLKANDGYKCSEFRTNSALGFQELNLPNVGTGTTTASISMTASQSALTQVLACPVAKDGTLFKSGVIVRSNGSGTAQTLGWKITGNGGGSDYFNRAMLPGSGLKLAKYVLTDGSYGAHTNFVPAFGGSMIMSTDVSAVQASYDNGTTWSPVGMTSIYANSVNYAAVQSSTLNSALGGGFASVVDPVLLLKFTVSTTFKASHSLASDTFVSGPITLISSVCAAPTAIKLVGDTSSNSYVATNLLNDLFATTTDFKETYHLQYVDTGCSGISVPIDALALTSSSTPACLSSADLYRDQVDGFKIVLDPKDSSGATCQMDYQSLNITSSSSPMTLFRSWPGSSGSQVTHSMTTALAGAFMDSNGLSNLSQSRLLLQTLIAGPSNSYTIWAGSLNSDSRVTTRFTGSILPSATTSWSSASAGASNWITPSASSTSSLGLATQSTLPSVALATMSQFNIQSGTTSGSIETLTSSLLDDVIGVSELWGSQVIITRNGGGQVHIYYVYRDGNGSAQGRTLFDMTPSGGLSTTANIYFVPSPNSGGDSATFTIAYADTVLTGSLVASNPISVVYSSPVSLGFGRSALGASARNGQIAIQFAGGTVQPNKIMFYESPTPIYNTGSVTAPNLNLVASSTSTAAAGWRVVRCNSNSDEIYGIQNTGSSVGIISYSSSSYNEAVRTVPTAINSSFDNVACTYIPTAYDGVKVLIFSNTGPMGSLVNFYSWAYDDSNGSCSSAPNTGINPSGSLTGTQSGALVTPYNGAIGNGFVIGRQNVATGKMDIVHQPATCSGGVVTLGATTVLGTIPSAASTLLTGVTNFTALQNSDAPLTFFGKTSQVLRFNLR